MTTKLRALFLSTVLLACFTHEATAEKLTDPLTARPAAASDASPIQSMALHGATAPNAQAQGLAGALLKIAANETANEINFAGSLKYYDGGASTGGAADEHLKTFDELDYDVFSNQDWTRLHLSHAKDVIVTWPDGHDTHGIDVHIEDLKKLFIHAPDTRIKQHPVRIGASNWTAVIGVMEGTFSNPMPIGDGKTIAPTNKTFALPMATIAFWENGRMKQEWLFWDNQTYMKQLGLAN